MPGGSCSDEWCEGLYGFSPPTEEHPPWNLFFKEPSSLLPLGTETWPQKSGHPRDLWVRLSQGSLLRCLWMLLCDTYPLNESSPTNSWYPQLLHRCPVSGMSGLLPTSDQFREREGPWEGRGQLGWPSSQIVYYFN